MAMHAVHQQLQLVDKLKTLTKKGKSLSNLVLRKPVATL